MSEPSHDAPCHSVYKRKSLHWLTRPVVLWSRAVPLISSLPSTPRSLFLSHAGLLVPQTCQAGSCLRSIHMLCPQCSSAFPRILSWLVPLPSSGICLHFTFSLMSSLTTSLKSTILTPQPPPNQLFFICFTFLHSTKHHVAFYMFSLFVCCVFPDRM